MTDFLITKAGSGVARVTSTDPFSTLEVHRVDRSVWTSTPELPGVYLLYGFIDSDPATSGTAAYVPAAYVGTSTTNMRDRIRSHHVTPKKNWFGVIFAIPLKPLLCPAVEAEMIRRVREADVVSVVNRADENRWLDSDDVHVAPAVDGIVDALECSSEATSSARRKTKTEPWASTHPRSLRGLHVPTRARRGSLAVVSPLIHRRPRTRM